MSVKKIGSEKADTLYSICFFFMQKLIKRILSIVMMVVFLIININSFALKAYAAAQIYADGGNWFDDLGTSVNPFIMFIAAECGAVANGDFMQALENYTDYMTWKNGLRDVPVTIKNHSGGGRSIELPSTCADELRKIIEDVARNNQGYLLFYPKTITDVQPGLFPDLTYYSTYNKMLQERGYGYDLKEYSYGERYYFGGTQKIHAGVAFAESSSTWANIQRGSYGYGEVKHLAVDLSSFWFSEMYFIDSGAFQVRYETSSNSTYLDRLYSAKSVPLYVFKDSVTAKNFIAGFSSIYFGQKQYTSDVVTVPVGAKIDYDKLYSTVKQAVVDSSASGTAMAVPEIEKLINESIASELKKINDSLGNIEDNTGGTEEEVGKSNAWLEKIYELLGEMDKTNEAQLAEIISKLGAINSDALKLSDFNSWMQKLYDKLGSQAPGSVDNIEVLNSILSKLSALDRIEVELAESNKLLEEILAKLGGMDDANGYLADILAKLENLNTDDSAKFEEFNQWLQKIHAELTGLEDIETVMKQVLEKLAALDTLNSEVKLTNEWLQKIYDKLDNTEHMDNLFGDIGKKIDDGFKSIVSALDVVVREVKSLKKWFVADAVMDALMGIFEGDTDASTFADVGTLIKGKFPFCLAWDFILIVEILFDGGDKVAPIFTIPIHIESIGFDYDMVLDLTIFDKCVQILRFFMTLFYCYGLMMLTARLTVKKG